MDYATAKEQLDAASAALAQARWELEKAKVDYRMAELRAEREKSGWDAPGRFTPDHVS